MNRKPAAGFSPDFDLPARDGSVAQNADPMVIERIPFPPWIAALEDCEFFFGQQGVGHFVGSD